MTEEEYFRKYYPDYCYGDRLLSPYWDLFQDGVEFGERQSEQKIADLEKENAVVGVNASGFIDTGGVSLGGQISGMCVSQGEYWGSYKSKYTLLGFDKDDRMIVGEKRGFSNS